MTAPAQGLAIQDIARAFLEGVEEHFASAGVALPDRRYLAPGSPEEIAWDCEQLVVSLSGIGWGQAPDIATTSPKMAAQSSAIAVRHAVLSVGLVRCTPSPDRNGKAPSVEKINAAGEEYLRDAGLLSQAITETCTRVKKNLDPTSMVQPGVVNPVGPSGGYHGMEGTVAITAGTLT